MKHILAIDPGDLSGWAKMDLRGFLIEWENLSQDEVMDKIENYPDPEDCEVVIYEEFKLFGHRAVQQRNSRFLASQIIGLLKSFARRHNIKLVVQRPENKDIGSKWSQLSVPSDHSKSHRYDAYNHGFYYLRLNHHIPTGLERQGK